MYKLHLILKYLRKRRIAWVSLIAVTLCTAMVIVVISVMGGWLRMFKESFHDATGDIVVWRRSLVGFSYYQEIIDKIEQLPEVTAATPVLRTYGLINVLIGDESRIQDMVQVVGMKLDKIDKITGFRRSLYRQYQQRVDEGEEPGEITKSLASFDKPLPPQVYRDLLPKAKGDVSEWKGVIVGAGVVGIGKDENGQIAHPKALYDAWIKLTVVPTPSGAVTPDLTEKRVENLWVVDDSRTKVWQTDSTTVYVPFDMLQRDLLMDEEKFIDQKTGKEMVEPARANGIHIGLRPGADLWATRDKIQTIVEQVLASHGQQAFRAGSMDSVKAQTWLEFNADLIGAVEHEKILVTFLFGIISIVAIFLIFCIFYMIVQEKTKDIGIIKSVGATNAGVAGIFLGYGLAIGIVGSILGLGFGYLIIHNINWIHEQMGKLMGIQIWSPKVYAFDTIPNTMNPPEIVIIMTIAIVASVLGALVPATRAASLHPVEALRWE